MQFISFFLLVFFVFPSPVLAYLDPGTGSFIIQVVIGAVLGSIYFIKSYWQKISQFIRSFFEKNNNAEVKNKKKR